MLKGVKDGKITLSSEALEEIELAKTAKESRKSCIKTSRRKNTSSRKKYKNKKNSQKKIKN
jgi:hypothetical protein